MEKDGIEINTSIPAVVKNSPKSIIKIGEYNIYVDKTFTPEQIEHIRDYFGFEIKRIDE